MFYSGDVLNLPLHQGEMLRLYRSQYAEFLNLLIKRTRLIRLMLHLVCLEEKLSKILAFHFIELLIQRILFDCRKLSLKLILHTPPTHLPSPWLVMRWESKY